MIAEFGWSRAEFSLARAPQLWAIALASPLVGAATVPLSEVSWVERTGTSPLLYRKNGRPVTYVVGDVAGTEEAPVYAILKMSDRIREIRTPGGYAVEERFVDDPARGDREAVVWDGEWRITYEVFRDMGVAFGAVLILIVVPAAILLAAVAGYLLVGRGDR